jgi:hypothetical protein
MALRFSEGPRTLGIEVEKQTHFELAARSANLQKQTHYAVQENKRRNSLTLQENLPIR